MKCVAILHSFSRVHNLHEETCTLSSNLNLKAARWDQARSSKMRPSQGSAWSMCKNCTVFCRARATVCGDRRGRVQQMMVFAISTCPRDLSQRSAWSMCRAFCDFCRARATVCGGRACQIALAMAMRIFAIRARPCAAVKCIEACAGKVDNEMHRCRESRQREARSGMRRASPE